jgi:hypothetical protein
MDVTAQSKSYSYHLSSSDNLTTTDPGIRGLQAATAQEQKRLFKPLDDQAHILRAWASRAATPADLVHITDIQAALLTAAGVSDKATKYMLQQDKVAAIQGLIDNFLEPAGADWVEELVYRFLLTRGDTLGGAMRNVAGALAQRKLTRAIIAALTIAQIPYHWQHSVLKQWATGTVDNTDVELYLRGLSWTTNGESRTMLYNLGVPLVGKNVDLCLLNCDIQNLQSAKKLKAVINDPVRYIALGELKGGIDPAGSDEHWKTARTALLRIREAFSERGLTPASFFVGAAIVKGMSEEIWTQLADGTLNNAANLTDANQVASLCRWLISL